MAGAKITQKEIERFLLDYEQVTGEKTDRFVCPITLRRCDISELIRGHIINEAIKDASTQTVIQYGRIDHFYGSILEPSLIRYLNMGTYSVAELIRQSDERSVTFDDGTEAEAFLVEGTKATKAAAERFPQCVLTLNGEAITVFLRCAKDDPRLKTPSISLTRRGSFIPGHWTGAMLKMGYLALFQMLGYRIVFDAFGSSVRNTLVDFYNNKGTRNDAPSYFKAYSQAVKLIITKTETGWTPATAEALPFDGDTLRDRLLLFHKTPSDTMFAATCVFRVNGMFITVTLPQSTKGADVAEAARSYNRLMANDPDAQQRYKTHLAKFDVDRWTVSGQPLPIGYQNAPVNQ